VGGTFLTVQTGQSDTLNNGCTIHRLNYGTINNRSYHIGKEMVQKVKVVLIVWGKGICSFRKYDLSSYM
jgi:hypothetical protein